MGIDCPHPSDRETVLTGDVELAHYRHTPTPTPTPTPHTLVFDSLD